MRSSPKSLPLPARRRSELLSDRERQLTVDPVSLMPPGGPAKHVAPPRDAASLIPYRRSRSGGIEVLMGRRHSKHSFVPDFYVFPGGGVDRADRRATAATSLRPDVTARVARSCRGSFARAVAFAMSAVRETYEETGLMLGAAMDQVPTEISAEWTHVYASGLGPDLAALDYVARARTPSHSPIRFDARFFLADAEAASGALGGTGELEDLSWRSLDDALKLPLVDVTEFLLGELLPAYFEAPPKPDPARPVPFFCFVRGRARVIDA
jgi:8-oxo-dGTP pyrophosphatase MutT (NUDIX family)